MTTSTAITVLSRRCRVPPEGVVLIHQHPQQYLWRDQASNPAEPSQAADLHRCRKNAVGPVRLEL